MSRVRHFTQLFALLACLTLLSAFGCSSESTLAPDTSMEPQGISSPQVEPNLSKYSGDISGTQVGDDVSGTQVGDDVSGTQVGDDVSGIKGDRDVRIADGN